VRGKFTNCIRELQFETTYQNYVYNINNSYYPLKLIKPLGDIAITLSTSDVTNFNDVNPCTVIVQIPISNGTPVSFNYTYLTCNNLMNIIKVTLSPDSPQKELTDYLEVGQSLEFSFHRAFKRLATSGGPTDIHIYTESELGSGPAGKEISFNPVRWTSNFTGTILITFKFVYTLIFDNAPFKSNPWFRSRIGMRNTGGTQVQTDLSPIDHVVIDETFGTELTYLYNVSDTQYIEFGDYFVGGTPNLTGMRYMGTATITIVRMS